MNGSGGEHGAEEGASATTNGGSDVVPHFANTCRTPASRVSVLFPSGQLFFFFFAHDAMVSGFRALSNFALLFGFVFFFFFSHAVVGEWSCVY